MLYDELVPQGEYLAHYGVPKDQWSPEARARHNRNHPQKGDVPPITYRQVYENIRGAYDEYQNNNYNRGGNRSTFGSKVDEHRAQAAEARRRNRRGAGYQTQSKPGDGQHVESYRKTPGLTSKTPGRNAKPGKNGKNADNSSNESKALNPNLITRVAQQINRSQENVNGRRRLSELGRNGQLVKQNSDMNRFLTSNGLNANSLRINPKGYNSAVQRGTVTEGDGRSHLKTNKRAENGKSSSRTSKPTPSSQSADQAIARNMRSGSSTKKNRKDQPNKKGNGSKKK